MTPSNEVFASVMQLPEQERADLAHRLLLSLEPEEFRDDEIAAAWQQEIEARLQKIASGTFQAHDWRQALQEIRQELRKDAPP
jgi:hypothetical protein